MRVRLLNRGLHPENAIMSLVALDSERAWKQVELLLSKGLPLPSAVAELAGNNSERAWAMREKMMETKADDTTQRGFYSRVSDGLIGLDNDRAWQMRDSLLSRGAEPSQLLYGLAGIESDRAWALRDELATSINPPHQPLSFSLGGLNSDRAWQMRKNLVLSDREFIYSINGARLTSIGWRAAKGMLPHQLEQAEQELEDA